MKHFLRVLSISLLLSNSFSFINAGGEAGPSQPPRLDKGKGRARSKSELSLEQFAAQFEEKEGSGSSLKQYMAPLVVHNHYHYANPAPMTSSQQQPGPSAAASQKQSELDRKDTQDRLNFSKQTKVLPDDLVKVLLKTAPEKLTEIMDAFGNIHHASKGLPKAIILAGAPGVGKSDLSRAMAQIIGFNIEFIHAPYLGDEFKKSSEQDLRRLIEPIEKRLIDPLAAESKTAVFIVFDEMQALTAGYKNKHQDFAVAIAFWLLVDKYSGNSKVYFIGTINETGDVPEQFKTRSKLIEIGLPDQSARKDILLYHLKDMTSESPEMTAITIDKSCYEFLDGLSKKTGYFTGRDLFFLIQTAIIKCNSRSKREGTLSTNLVLKKEDLQKAFDEKKTDVYKCDYAKGKLQKGWDVAAPVIGRNIIPVLGLAVQIYIAERQISSQGQTLALQKQSLSLQNLAFKFQRMVARLPYLYNVWLKHKDSNAIELFERFENTEIPEAQRVLDPSLDLANTYYNCSAVANLFRQSIPAVVTGAASGAGSAAAAAIL